MEWNIKFFDIVVSTNKTALEYPPAFVILAEQQLAGKGRYQRIWQSPKGNLYASFVFKKEEFPSYFYSFILGISVISSFSQKLYLKWPNDIMYENKKCGGILLEETEETVIAGIGLNLISCPTSGVSYPTSYINATESPLTITKKISKNINKYLIELEKKGFSKIREIWLKNAFGLNKEVVISLPNHQISGIFKTISEKGELILQDNNSEKNISFGDIFFK